MTTSYQDFLAAKRIEAEASGFEVDEADLNPQLFPFQRAIVRWALKKGRAAVFSDCGTGKTPVQLEWARHVAARTGKPVLILAPLAVGPQTVREGDKFGIEVQRSDDGSLPSLITITNYERLHYFKSENLGGVVCDESSILKSFDGTTKAEITEFMRPVPFRLLCTATAAPNDYIELGTSSEALSELGYIDMLNRFFVREQKADYKRGGFGQDWRFKGHGEQPFWRWVASWARACRKPSDLGFEDGGFQLPSLIENETVVEARIPRPDRLFDVTAVGLAEEREVRRRTIAERCETAAEKAQEYECSVIWCHLNDEQRRLEQLLGDRAFSVHGSMELEEKERQLSGWIKGERPYLLSKPVVAGWGLNFQHCNHVVYFPTDSYELYYQAVRRCWRFGQGLPVTVDIVRTTAQERMMTNLHRKSQAADRMFSDLVSYMNEAQRVEKGRIFTEPTARPALAVAEQAITEDYAIYLGDACELMTDLPTESVHLSVYSPPFAGLFQYSSSPRDLSNSRDYDEFFHHYEFVVRDLHRLTLPGRMTAVHCMDVPSGNSGLDYLIDFPGDIIRLHEECGWHYMARYNVWKEPLTVRNRTMAKKLAHRTVVEDSSRCGVASADYLLVFRRSGQNPIPIEHPHGLTEYAGERPIPQDVLPYREWQGNQIENRYSHWIWRQYASAFWDDVRLDRVLPFRDARDEEDEKHIHPLQLDVIERCLVLWSNPGETVFTPFMGVGSEVYAAVQMGRRGIGVELKPSYYRQAERNLEALTAKDQAIGQMTVFDQVEAVS